MDAPLPALENVTALNTPETLEELIQDDSLTTRIHSDAYAYLSLICVAANTLIISVTVKYRNLRQEKANEILLYWAIFNSLYLLASTASVRVAIDWPDVVSEPRNWYCCLEQLDYTLFVVNILLIFFLTSSWYLKLYYPNKFFKLANSKFRLLMYGVCAVAAIYSGFHLNACLKNVYTFPTAFLFVGTSLYISFMVAVNILHNKKKGRLIDYCEEQNVVLILSNTFFLSNLPALLSIEILPVFGAEFSFNFVSIVTLVSITTPILFLIILCKCEKDYRTFFRDVLRCRCGETGEDVVVEYVVVYNNEATSMKSTVRLVPSLVP